MGDAITTTLLLSDWERYGLSERVSYHFDLIETLVASSADAYADAYADASSQQPTQQPHQPLPTTHTNASSRDNISRQHQQSSSPSDTTSTSMMIAPATTNFGVCGVVGLLECVPFAPLAKLNRRQRRALRNDSRDFNLSCLRVREEAARGRGRVNNNSVQKQKQLLQQQQRQQQQGGSTGDDDEPEPQQDDDVDCHPDTSNDDQGNKKANAYYCHEPRQLPLKLNPASRLFFAYEVTRIAFCLDASPTLTSTFGMSNSGSGGNDLYGDGSCCPIDRVGSMARIFFQALCSESMDNPFLIPTTMTASASSSATNKSGANNNTKASSSSMQRMWRPELQVSVIAVFPRGTGLPQTQLLVRDFRVNDQDSATVLAQRIEEWALNEVESEIARRLSQSNRYNTTGNNNGPNGAYADTNNNFNNNLLDGYDAWSIKLHSSSLRDILDAGDVSLSILSSAAKPCIVVATDGRSVSCDGVMDILADADRSDVPLVVLDLSDPNSHSQYHHDENKNTCSNNNTTSGAEQQQQQQSGGESRKNRHDQLSLISHDPGGPSTFPLHLSDDTAALHGICRATGGCFFDAELLQQAAVTIAGQQEDSPFHVDHYFSFKRRYLKPNAVQWYVLFSLSPLSPTLSSAWGQIVPPRYLRDRAKANNNSGNNMANAN